MRTKGKLTPNFLRLSETNQEKKMSKLLLYPIMISEYVPFLCFVRAENEKEALKYVDDKFPSLKTMGQMEINDPITISDGKVFVVDPELFILHYNDDVKYWLGDNSEQSNFYNENGILQSDMSELFNDALPSEESEEKNNVILLPEKSPKNGNSPQERHLVGTVRL